MLKQKITEKQKKIVKNEQENDFIFSCFKLIRIVKHEYYYKIKIIASKATTKLHFQNTIIIIIAIIITMLLFNTYIIFMFIHHDSTCTYSNFKYFVHFNITGKRTTRA